MREQNFSSIHQIRSSKFVAFLHAIYFVINHCFFKVALSSFYEEESNDLPEERPIPIAMERDSDSSDDNENVSKPAAAAVASVKKEGKGGLSRNIATISSVRGAEPTEDEKGQAYYAGGSEHSGQQVIGPPRKNPVKDLVSEVFKQAQSGKMDQFDDEEEHSEPRFSSFEGTGYRLGQSSEDSVTVKSSSGSKKRDDCDTVTVKVYRQGFTVDDGEIRPYEDPRNREFFESITRNEIPSELRKQGKSMVHVNVENHLEEEYVKKAPMFKAFTGSGQTLGSPAPATTTSEEVTTSTGASAGTSSASTNADNEAKAAAELGTNESDPTTMISVRLASGTRISARFNLTHTVQDIRQYITTARPEYLGRNFMLLTTFPNKELPNPADTIQQAGLQNAAILQRMK